MEYSPLHERSLSRLEMAHVIQLLDYNQIDNSYIEDASTILSARHQRVSSFGRPLTDSEYRDYVVPVTAQVLDYAVAIEDPELGGYLFNYQTSAQKWETYGRSLSELRRESKIEWSETIGKWRTELDTLAAETDSDHHVQREKTIALTLAEIQEFKLETDLEAREKHLQNAHAYRAQLLHTSKGGYYDEALNASVAIDIAFAKVGKWEEIMPPRGEGYDRYPLGFTFKAVAGRLSIPDRFYMLRWHNKAGKALTWINDRSNGKERVSPLTLKEWSSVKRKHVLIELVPDLLKEAEVGYPQISLRGELKTDIVTRDYVRAKRRCSQQNQVQTGDSERLANALFLAQHNAALAS
jgi:hypothetical protein